MRIRNRNFDFIGRRKIWFTISIVAIAAGIIGFIVNGGFNLGIDFLGGSLIEVKFDRPTDTAEIREIMGELGYDNVIIQKVIPDVLKDNSDQFIIRIKAKNLGESISTEEKNEILNLLDRKIGITGQPLQDRTVEPGFGSILVKNALIAIAISIAGILIYVWIRFEIRFGAAAILALVHDVLITLGVYCILNREVNTSTIAAILTILGYSLNDTIVVFDRIRENTSLVGKLGYDRVLNDSINAILSRSINTSLTTLFPVVLLLIMGTTALKDFALALTVGIVAGTYSSICIASPLLAVWNKKFPKYKK
ncbi:MAG: protein translocase subunit SecF [Candidatus Humimicrobiaceae bacterium]|jgi:preprotein translocase SecF subunit|nr:protein translocase subunit SecF [Actinomycetota bacterium]MDY0027653.1 protein translocase subunit SecF [Candidatus Humimicrobiaceae bacterium]